MLFTGLGALGVMHFQHTGVVAHPGTTSMLEGMQAQLLKLERNQERGMDVQQKILERLAVIEREVKLTDEGVVKVDLLEEPEIPG